MHEEAALYLYVVFDGSFIPQECCTRNKKKCGRTKNNKVIMIKYDGKFNIFFTNSLLLFTASYSDGS